MLFNVLFLTQYRFSIFFFLIFSGAYRFIYFSGLLLFYETTLNKKVYNYVQILQYDNKHYENQYLEIIIKLLFYRLML